MLFTLALTLTPAGLQQAACRSGLIPNTNKIVVAMLLCLLPVIATGQRDPQREVAELAQLLRLSDATVLADVGAGSGEWTFLLAPVFPRTVATPSFFAWSTMRFGIPR